MYRSISDTIEQECLLKVSEADPGFVVRGGVSKRGVWGPLKVPSGQGQSPGRGPRGALPPLKLWGFEELRTFI
jgi:hypothetical protein